MLLKGIKKIYNVLDKICEPIACACLVVVIVLTFINAILRYVFSIPLGWAEEISTLMYTFMVFFGLSGTLKTGSAVGVDIVVSLLPQKGRKIVDVIATVISLVVWLILVYLGARLALQTKGTATPYLLIPYRYIYWFMPISGFFCVIQLIYRLVHILDNSVYQKKEA